ncbi:cell wall metabolism sensor histidine kinase WalK [Paenibacillus sp. YN15]|uniref:sensor histidine kinase n=1 Tax=Paenibacillus sp. YN15 TaxID=1742774 RepID=UPI000DCDD559|nr:HAMP domain-containing sensor histidine kinase [Paenibacillus sp. YN15]RAV02060.1 sensor histidine kinase [Paenibacillus sp. YN15]
MKNRPLAFQIWAGLVVLTTAILLLVFLLMPVILNRYVSREIYASIESEQEVGIRRGESGLADPNLAERQIEQQDKRTVKTFLLLVNGQQVVSLRNIPAVLLEDARKQSAAQTAATGRYKVNVDGERLFYVIRQIKILNRQMTVVSYMWDTYYHNLMKGMMRQLVWLSAAVLCLSLLPAVWLSRSLSRPLVVLSEFVKGIARRQWNEPLAMERRDEIGQLADSIEIMRDRLKRQDDYQQTMLQHVSHELKTPVMVIRSYAQSMEDGIYPKGDLEGSVRVIGQESERLEKLVRKLLYLTKLDYVSAEPAQHQTFRLDQTARNVLEKLRWQRPELTYETGFAPVTVVGDEEQWIIAVENLLDNQIRYANSRVTLRVEAPSSLLLGNDGPPLPAGLAEQAFSPFRSGPGGQFGLGLTIVKRIAELHQAKLHAGNTAGGVEFRLDFPAP